MPTERAASATDTVPSLRQQDEFANLMGMVAGLNFCHIFFLCNIGTEDHIINKTDNVERKFLSLMSVKQRSGSLCSSM